MGGKIGLYFMAKPECSKYLVELEETLNENNFPIKQIYKVRNWEALSREMYNPQLLSSSEDFVLGFEGHVWLIKHLFGNRGLILILEDEIQKGDLSLKDKLQRLYDTKQKFRTKISESLNGTLVFNVNLDRLNGSQFNKGGNIGHLGTFNNGAFTSFSDQHFGRWDYLYLKYVHSPDVDIGTLEYEWSTLLRNNILAPENRIERREWELMKKLKTHVPPNEYEPKK